MKNFETYVNIDESDKVEVIQNQESDSAEHREASEVIQQNPVYDAKLISQKIENLNTEIERLQQERAALEDLPEEVEMVDEEIEELEAKQDALDREIERLQKEKDSIDLLSNPTLRAPLPAINKELPSVQRIVKEDYPPQSPKGDQVLGDDFQFRFFSPLSIAQLSASNDLLEPLQKISTGREPTSKEQYKKERLKRDKNKDLFFENIEATQMIQQTKDHNRGVQQSPSDYRRSIIEEEINKLENQISEFARISNSNKNNNLNIKNNPFLKRLLESKDRYTKIIAQYDENLKTLDINKDKNEIEQINYSKEIAKRILNDIKNDIEKMVYKPSESFQNWSPSEQVIEKPIEKPAMIANMGVRIPSSFPSPWPPYTANQWPPYYSPWFNMTSPSRQEIERPAMTEEIIQNPVQVQPIEKIIVQQPAQDLGSMLVNQYNIFLDDKKNFIKTIESSIPDYKGRTFDNKCQIRKCLNGAYDMLKRYYHGYPSTDIINEGKDITSIDATEKNWNLIFKYLGTIGIGLAIDKAISISYPECAASFQKYTDALQTLGSSSTERILQ